MRQGLIGIDLLQRLHRLNLLQVLQRRLGGGHTRRRGSRGRPGGGRCGPTLAMLQGAQAEVGVLRHFVHAGGELLDSVPQLLDLAGQPAHLALELLQPDLLIRGDTARGGPAAPGRCLAAVDLLLEIGELLLQAIDLLRERLDIVLRPRQGGAGDQHGDRQPGRGKDQAKGGDGRGFCHRITLGIPEKTGRLTQIKLHQLGQAAPALAAKIRRRPQAPVK